MPDSFTTLYLGDPDYPPLLAQISDPPQSIFVRGNITLLSHPNLLAVVGSRKANTYGRAAIAKILPSIVATDIPIVSGLALGIDGLAHNASVHAGKQTIAVLGNGIDTIYPRAHTKLAEEILQNNGAIVSEYPPNSPINKSNFPQRNRIIAGLCPVTLIVQADIRSGSLITARLALESGREVCAIPGPITDPLCSGTNQLIQQGAHPVNSDADILALYNLQTIEISKKS